MPRAQPETTQETIDRLHRHMPAMSPEDRERAERAIRALEGRELFTTKRKTV